jgi:hypothetical protein
MPRHFALQLLHFLPQVIDCLLQVLDLLGNVGQARLVVFLVLGRCRLGGLRLVKEPAITCDGRGDYYDRRGNLEFREQHGFQHPFR